MLYWFWWGKGSHFSWPYLRVFIRYSVNVPPFHHFTISYLLIFRMELVQLLKLLVGIINLILQLLCTVKQQVTLSTCLNAKPNKFCCLYSLLYLKRWIYFPFNTALLLPILTFLMLCFIQFRWCILAKFLDWYDACMAI